MIDKINEMLPKLLESQNKVNSIINPNWLEDLDSTKICLAIISECGELVDSIGYEWWKNVKVDENNIKIEIVDIAHFVFTLVMKELYNRNKDFAKAEVDVYFDALTDELNKDKYEFYHYIITEIINTAYLSTLDNKIVNKLLAYLFASVMYEFRSIEEFAKEFLTKNALNIARNKLGYKDGTYQKVINGKEDNVHIKELIKDTNELDVDSIVNRYIDWYNRTV